MKITNNSPVDIRNCQFMRIIKVYRVECFWGPMKEEFNETDAPFTFWYKHYIEHNPKFEANHDRDVNRMTTGECYIDLYDDETYVGTAYYNYNEHQYKVGNDGLVFSTGDEIDADPDEFPF